MQVPDKLCKSGATLPVVSLYALVTCNGCNVVGSTAELCMRTLSQLRAADSAALRETALLRCASLEWNTFVGSGLE